ncbi:hypothetical protein JD844_006269 [Phrynosoma platyrhinos]|uniref:Rho-GAP domain-containing protein n=1 Tax=Phrynosoma platyrhinos TaxID=52577 RepID=A0ABQ7T182_PHRPL|nr:hypothetical protein JD844_006269 [Phrynosoma platyrhinos]
MLAIPTGLNHRGLFRISGSAVKIKTLKKKYDEGEEVDLVNEGDVDSIASLLKLFLNELPVAVFPDDLSTEILTTFEGKQLYAGGCFSLLSPTFVQMNMLLYLENVVASHSDVNHMTMENLAIVFGPTLFRIPRSPSACEKQTICNAILLHFLQHHKEILVDGPSSQCSLMEGNDHPQDLCPTMLMEEAEERLMEEAEESSNP